ncbi:MOZ protein represents a chromatin-associated acetyltransferase [Neofusicoccum parvum]|uniref:MOZ protein represents a chromatin-associated acetyltransferase n=1 Tax=Neofusicoccum parvum TaxID=310453 RepID=A0ACB5SGZ1_9PEZI|nr:MOZ protein represents a chromatin-associated acetyltransferase [Neofusicoccum parvum]GME59712.1 MOZ protein represents a chromatin-associated acetyltransferase [Neofusicoccum parvum]
MQRYGTANEPLPSPAGGSENAAGSEGGSGGEDGAKAAAADGARDADAARPGASPTAAATAAAAGAAAAASASGGAAETSSQEKQEELFEGPAADPNAPPRAASPTIFETSSQGEAPKPAPAAANNGTETESNPLEAVLRMPAPSSRPVHLTTPRYVHHFDTWSLVKQLAGSGFKEDQSITLMKAIRAQLNDNMELARAGLVGKSDVENETYLFRAACSELRTEVGNNRKAENERMTTQRNQLQHEVDILGQRLGQDTGHLREEVKGMFDDRKMAVRMEQKTMESKIQELNYKITVALNSDARSEVEGLRWIITRRAVTALVVVAVAILATLRFSSYMTHTQALERKNMTKPQATAKQEEQDNKATTGGAGSGTHSGNGGGHMDAGAGVWADSPAAKALGEEGAGDGVMVSEGGVSLG